MLKALVKKQLMEFFAGFFVNAKSGKAHSKSSRIGIIVLFALVFISFFAMFFSIAYMLSPVIASDYPWLYYAIMGILASLLGIFGSVFMTYNTLYEAKDNDLLLSMPVPPSMILASRMLGVYFSSLLFEAMVFIPACIVYFMNAKLSVAAVVLSLLNIFILPLFALVISCVLGWFIALFAARLRSKGLITVLFSICFFAVYYIFTMRLNLIINAIITKVDEVSKWISDYLYLFYKMGKGCTGDIVSYLAFLFIVLAVFAVVYKVLSHSFIKFATTKVGAKKKEYKEEKLKTASVKGAFLKKEFTYFINTPPYMLNCALGSVLTVVMTVMLIVKKDDLFLMLSLVDMPFLDISVIAGFVLCFVASTNNITSPSISLEAKHLWILKSVPVRISDIFFAKVMLHVLVTGVPLTVCSIVISVILKNSLLMSVLSLVFSLLFISVCAMVGLVANLLFPKLDWTNETVPIKQSVASLIGMFFGLLLTMLTITVFFLTAGHIAAEIFMSVFIAVFTLVIFLLWRWTSTKGAEKFLSL